MQSAERRVLRRKRWAEKSWREARRWKRAQVKETHAHMNLKFTIQRRLLSWYKRAAVCAFFFFLNLKLPGRRQRLLRVFRGEGRGPDVCFHHTSTISIWSRNAVAGFESTQMCYYLHAQVCPDAFAHPQLFGWARCGWPELFFFLLEPFFSKGDCRLKRLLFVPRRTGGWAVSTYSTAHQPLIDGLLNIIS